MIAEHAVCTGDPISVQQSVSCDVKGLVHHGYLNTPNDSAADTALYPVNIGGNPAYNDAKNGKARTAARRSTGATIQIP